MVNKLLVRDTAQDRIAPRDDAIPSQPPVSIAEPPGISFTDTVSLGEYLRQCIFPQLGPPPYGDIEILPLSREKPVYLFLEKTQNMVVVRKLFQHGPVTLERAWPSAQKEYFNLSLLRNRFGMNSGSRHVVAPLGMKKELAALLVTEKAPGKLLDHYIEKAVYEHQPQKLFDRLTSLAGFFAKLHHNSETDRQVSPVLPQSYLIKLLDSLAQSELIPDDRTAIKTYAAQWWDLKEVWTDHQVIVHGDATTTNFLFHHNEVTGIDLEKMKWADRCWDLGFISAELKHHFLWRTGDKWAAEPFIGHFLWQYAVSYADGQSFFDITRKIPLYMALGLLRIARNSWLDEKHRKDLISEAKLCLRYGLSSSITTTPS